MKPDWKRILLGISCVILVYLGLVVSGLDLRVVKYFDNLPTGRAQFVGSSIALLIMSLSAALGFVLAKRKGRRSLMWMSICFLLNVWALIYLWSLPDLGDARSAESANRLGRHPHDR